MFQKHLGGFYSDIKSGGGAGQQVLEHHDIVDDGKGGERWVCPFGNRSEKSEPLLIVSRS